MTEEMKVKTNHIQLFSTLFEWQNFKRLIIFSVEILVDNGTRLLWVVQHHQLPFKVPFIKREARNYLSPNSFWCMVPGTISIRYICAKLRKLKRGKDPDSLEAAAARQMCKCEILTSSRDPPISLLLTEVVGQSSPEILGDFSNLLASCKEPPMLLLQPEIIVGSYLDVSLTLPWL